MSHSTELTTTLLCFDDFFYLYFYNGTSSSLLISPISFFFFFNDTATTEIYTLSLHDALPISSSPPRPPSAPASGGKSQEFLSGTGRCSSANPALPETLLQQRSFCRTRQISFPTDRSEEHTSELQSLRHLVCRLLLEKKKKPTRGWHYRSTVISFLSENPVLGFLGHLRPPLISPSGRRNVQNETAVRCGGEGVVTVVR